MKITVIEKWNASLSVNRDQPEHLEKWNVKPEGGTHFIYWIEMESIMKLKV